MPVLDAVCSSNQDVFNLNTSWLYVQTNLEQPVEKMHADEIGEDVTTDVEKHNFEK